MELEQILEVLGKYRGYFPREAVEEAVRRKDEITPHLLRSLEDAARIPADSEAEPPYLPLFALFLLAQFRERRAYPLVMALCRLPEKTLDSLIGDTLTEGLPHIIASVFDGDTAPIKAVVEDPAAYEFARSSALRALSILVYEGVVARAEVIAYFAELLRGRLEKEPSHVWDALASEAAALHATPLLEDLRAAYGDGLIDPGFASLTGLERDFAQPEEQVLAESKERHGGLIDDVIKEMEWWHCFHKDEDARRRPPVLPRVEAGRHDPDAVVREGPKIGRNAPCPCGSGKKYKKCCGAG